MTVKPADGTIEFTLFDVPPPAASASADERNVLQLPRYIVGIKDHLEAVLEKADLHLWLMIDRLDEIFLRRSELETRALRGLLRTLQVFQSPRIRVKIFLRDDILEQVTLGTAGFTALTHITARRADKLQWSAEQILDLIVKRVFSSDVLCRLLQVDEEKLRASREYREEVFYQFFPPTVHRGARQSTTLRWIYNHTMDGRGVVTPRDVIDLLTRARQKQEDEFEADPGGSASYVIGSAAIRYGLAELSRWKRDSLLRAEYPHCWPHIEKFQRGKAEYTERAIKRVLGKDAMHIVQDLIGIGVIGETKTKGARTFKIPFLYREGLDVTQGLQE